jgi:hypothetical protein
MKARIALALALALTLKATVSADTTIVSDNFDGYADTNAFLQTWAPVGGNGTFAIDPSDTANYQAGILTSDPLSNPANFPGVQGQAVDHIGSAASPTATTPGEDNQYGGPINQSLGQNPLFQIAPSATQSIFLSVDFYDGASANERMSIGLRNIVGSADGTDADPYPDAATANIIEMGLYNSNSADPFTPGLTVTPSTATSTTPGFYAGRGFAARVQSFGTKGSDSQGTLQVQPDWQYFRTDGESGSNQGFDVGLERTTDTDSVVTEGDVGKGWHRYTATITPTTVTFTIDLFRDGLKNTSKDPVTPGGDDRPGTPGVDATMTFPIAPTAAGFNALRIGGPSGLSSAGPGATGFDNVVLKLIDVVTPPSSNADFNNDGKVDGADFLVWQKGQGLTGQTDKSHGDANGDGSVNAGDLSVWQQTFGTSPTAAVAVTGVPEPASILLTAVALLSVAGLRRR